MSPSEIDETIASNSPAIRTISGHCFEVVFSKILQINDVPHEEVGGDSDYDFQILGKTLQLKTKYKQGCKHGVVAYKTHKTHGAKSKSESDEYFHLANTFADYLVGHVSYDPFEVLIIPRDAIPRRENDAELLDSPVKFEIEQYKQYLNNFTQLSISDDITYPTIINLGNKELLPRTAEAIGVRSNYIIDAIFRPENFRVWDMNLRGFIREKHFANVSRQHNVVSIDPRLITDRPEKVDIALVAENGENVRFQVKGITSQKSYFNGIQSTLNCETQLSRGRVNDHPTQSRLYLATDFDGLLLALDPAYTNSFSIECFGRPDYNWSFYAIPTAKLRRHQKFHRRLASNQTFRYIDIQHYRIDEDWFNQWRKSE